MRNAARGCQAHEKGQARRQVQQESHWSELGEALAEAMSQVSGRGACPEENVRLWPLADCRDFPGPSAPLNWPFVCACRKSERITMARGHSSCVALSLYGNSPIDGDPQCAELAPQRIACNTQTLGGLRHIAIHVAENLGQDLSFRGTDQLGIDIRRTGF